MFLYKQMVDEQGSVGSLELLMKSESLDELKAEAVRIAADLGCLHISWLWGKDSNRFCRVNWMSTSLDRRTCRHPYAGRICPANA